jgi:hypothetical protein
MPGSSFLKRLLPALLKNTDRTWSAASWSQGTVRPLEIRMNWSQKTAWCCVLLLLAPLVARAADVQVLPEFEENLKLNSAMRLGFDAQGDRDEGTQVSTSLGPNLEFYLKPLILLKHVTTFDLNDSKSRFLVAAIEYRSITGEGSPNQNRMTLATTSNFPMKDGFLISDRNRSDITWKSGSASTWRYRNKLEIDRTFAVHGYHLIPYVAAEPYYIDEYGKWSETALTAGCFFPVGGHVQFETYYEHDNITSKKQNSQTENIGITLHLYFSMEKPPKK